MVGVAKGDVMSARAWHLVCYDVRDAARLRHMAKLLEGYGERLQYSVFRCRLTPREEEQLCWELTRLLAPEDAWLIIPLCDSCVERVHRRDSRRAWPADPPNYVVV